MVKEHATDLCRLATQVLRYVDNNSVMVNEHTTDLCRLATQVLRYVDNNSVIGKQHTTDLCGLATPRVSRDNDNLVATNHPDDHLLVLVYRQVSLVLLNLLYLVQLQQEE